MVAFRFLSCTLLVYAVLSAGFALEIRSDDVDVKELQNIIQQQSALIQTLQAKLASVESSVKQQSLSMQTMQTKLTSLESKQMKRVAFTAGFSGHALANIGNKGVVKFNRTIANFGDGYSPTIGVFTAPVAGIYGLHLNIRSIDPHNWIRVVLAKNGGILCYAVAQAGDQVPFDKGACFVTTRLNVGDKVFARHDDGGTALEEGQYTMFSGFLLSPD